MSCVFMAVEPATNLIAPGGSLGWRPRELEICFERKLLPLLTLALLSVAGMPLGEQEANAMRLWEARLMRLG